MSELISVITPVYNSEKYIGDTIKSVQQQSHTNWEMWIVDDCSKDNTSKIVQEFLSKDSRINYVRLDQNSGAAKARNIALKKASGRYIAFLDADDMWKKNKLELQLNFMKNKSAAFSYTAYEILNEKQNKLVSVPEKINYSQYMKNTIIGMLTVMIDRNKIDNFEIVDIPKDHDSMTWAKLLRENNDAYGLNESLAYYRKVNGSISNNKFKAIKRHWKNCREIENIGIITCVYYFGFYIFNAIKKHYF